mgnify:CR=1 FL=1
MTEMKAPNRQNANPVGPGEFHGLGDSGQDYDTHPDSKVELLTYVLDGQAFAVDIMMVREIRGWSEPTPIVDAPPYVRGMINLRGVILPVFDLAVRLKGSVAGKESRGVIIVVETSERAAGLMVDGVTDIIGLSKDDLRVPPSAGGTAQNGMICNLVVTDDRIIQLLDLDAVLGEFAEH